MILFTLQVDQMVFHTLKNEIFADQRYENCLEYDNMSQLL